MPGGGAAGAYMPRASQTRSPVSEDEFEVTFSPHCFGVGLNKGTNRAYSLSLPDLHGVDF